MTDLGAQHIHGYFRLLKGQHMRVTFSTATHISISSMTFKRKSSRTTVRWRIDERKPRFTAVCDNDSTGTPHQTLIFHLVLLLCSFCGFSLVATCADEPPLTATGSQHSNLSSSVPRYGASHSITETTTCVNAVELLEVIRASVDQRHLFEFALLWMARSYEANIRISISTSRDIYDIGDYVCLSSGNEEVEDTTLPDFEFDDEGLGFIFTLNEPALGKINRKTPVLLQVKMEFAEV